MNRSEFAAKAAWGTYGEAIAEWTGKLDRQSVVKRIWDKDATLWKKEAAAQAEIKNRLGWLAAVAGSKKSAREWTSFADEVKASGVEHVVLLGMGGSSLAPEVFQRTFGNAAGFPALTVLDSTDPARVADVEKAIDLEKTLFVVSSKSGGTIELLSFFKYFHAKVKSGDRFIAITDPGTPLVELAKQHNFRRVFLAPEDVGGRFSALTCFGLVPAALIGVDLGKVLEGAERMVSACSPESAAESNPAAALGVGMAVLAESGLDKLTILAPQALESFGDWAEQLVGESTGKEGSGVVPIVAEPVAEVAKYGEDRFFVALRLASEPDEAFDKRVAALEKAGRPVLSLTLADRSDIGAEFFRWEFATALACALLKINPFDQPDVQSTKDRTKALLRKLEDGGEIPLRESSVPLDAFWENAEPGDYAAILAFVPDREPLRKKLVALQKEIRDRTKLAVTLGFGPRYLHSTGQLHKGGPKTGVFFLITAAPSEDIPVPGEKYTFGQLELAQAMGDFEALETKGRWLFHVRLDSPTEEALGKLHKDVTAALKAGAAHEKELSNY